MTESQHDRPGDNEVERTYKPTKPPSFTCPACGMTSYNPNDVREGYCGNCHVWTP